MFTKRTSLALIKAVFTKKNPIYVQYAITKRCNLACRMCGSSESRKEEKELSLPEIEKLAGILARLNTGIVVLTGGEPFLRDDLPQIIRTFSKRGFTVRLQTNGILASAEKIQSAYKAGMREVTVSLNSLEPEKQDLITGQKGSWYKIIESIARFSQNLPLKRSILGINTVVSKQNLKEIPDIIRFVTKIGFYSSLIPLHISLSEKDDFIIRKYVPEFAFQSGDFKKLDETYKMIIGMKKQGYHIYNSHRFLSNSPLFLKEKKVNWFCDSPNLYFAISPSGNFLPCVDIKTSESMLDDNFVNLYNSREFRNKMDDMVKKCLGCFYSCWPEMTFLCRDPLVFVERIHFSIKAYLRKRKPVTYENCVSIIEGIKNTK